MPYSIPTEPNTFDAIYGAWAMGDLSNDEFRRAARELGFDELEIDAIMYGRDKEECDE